MSFKPNVAVVVADPVIQVAVATTLAAGGQVAEVDTTAGAVTITLPDAALDGKEFAVKWAAADALAANLVTVVTQTGATYKLVAEDGSVVASAPLGVVGEVVTMYFSRTSPTSGVFARR